MEPGASVHKAAAAGDYGAVIRLCRKERGLTLQEVARTCGYSHSALSRIERRGTHGGYDVAALRHIAETLDIAPGLLGLAANPHRSEPRPVRPTAELAGTFPAGHVFSPTLPTATAAAAAVRRRNGRMVIDVADTVDPVTPVRGLIVAQVDDELVAIDARQARRRLARSAPGAPLNVPAAYVLDDLTVGVAWAVANLDEPLLGDDARLYATQSRLFGHTLSGRALALTGAGELHPVSKMWLGSAFCARHISANMDLLTQPPTFWTQERRGEQASGWLLFAHKLDYLRTTSTRYQGATMQRAFCIPPDAVASSPPPERVLLLLAAALIESFGIKVAVCTDPGYTATEGCVLDSDRQAIVASWLDTDALWHVAVTQARPDIREFSDAIGYAAHHSVIAAATPPARLHALADYLALDWAWLVRRCFELSEHGTAGLAEPSSRLLSLAGIDRACQFLGRMGRAT